MALLKPVKLFAPLTFLTSVLVTVCALHVIPLITVFYTKCVYTIFSAKVVRLFCSPGGEISRTTIFPNEVSLCGFVVEPKPGLLTIVSMLDKYIFFVVFNIDKHGILVSTFVQSCGPVGTFLTREVAVAVKIAPPWVTNICAKKKF